MKQSENTKDQLNLKKQIRIAIGSTALICSLGYTTGAFAADDWEVVKKSNDDEKGVVIPSNILTLTPKGETFAKTGYTKIANDGSKLTDSANLGANPKECACTRDNKTGLIWEVKTTDGGLRDMNNYYSWYEPDSSKNGGFEGYKNRYPDACKGSDCDTYAFTNAVNTQHLCGATDWRMPSIDELKGIMKLSASYPSIDTTYFPNTKSNWFWSSSPYAGDSDNAWGIFFDYGVSDYSHKDDYGSNVRLVR